jgi:hypothetical protein
MKFAQRFIESFKVSDRKAMTGAISIIIAKNTNISGVIFAIASSRRPGIYCSHMGTVTVANSQTNHSTEIFIFQSSETPSK